MTQTTISFDKVPQCPLETLELIACYTYGSGYENLTNLCDEQVSHEVEGTLGTCFEEFSVSLLQDQVSQLTSEPIILTLASAVTETFVVDLSSIAIS